MSGASEAIGARKVGCHGGLWALCARAESNLGSSFSYCSCPIVCMPCQLQYKWLLADHRSSRCRSSEWSVVTWSKRTVHAAEGITRPWFLRSKTHACWEGIPRCLGSSGVARRRRIVCCIISAAERGSLCDNFPRMSVPIRRMKSDKKLSKKALDEVVDLRFSRKGSFCKTNHGIDRSALSIRSTIPR